MTENIILISAFVAVAAAGYFLISRFDAFLEKNHKALKDKPEVKPPSCVMLKDNLTDDEIIDEIKCFREQNENICIVVYNNSNENSEKNFSKEDDSDL